jgi:hypothetical protein
MNSVVLTSQVVSLKATLERIETTTGLTSAQYLAAHVARSHLRKLIKRLRAADLVDGGHLA